MTRAQKSPEGGTRSSASLVPTLALTILLPFTGTWNPPAAAAIDVSATAPQTVFSDLNNEISAQLDLLVAQAEQELARYDDQTELVRGFADATAAASAVATPRTRFEYEVFAVTIGSMVGAQLPFLSISPQAAQAALEQVQEEGDVNAGLAWQVWSAHIGVNGGFLLDGLFLGLKFGRQVLEYQGLTMTALNLGLTARYNLVKGRSLLPLVKWTGVTVGSGFLYEHSRISYLVPVDVLEAPVSYDPDGPGGADPVTGTVLMDPTVELASAAGTATIPVDVLTGIELLWVVNLTLGAGFDVSFGVSEIDLSAAGSTNLEGDLAALQTAPGSVTVDGGTGGVGPSVLRPRFTAVLALTPGPVTVEVPLTYYIGYGFHLGLNVTGSW